jgi:hypothetical protein
VEEDAWVQVLGVRRDGRGARTGPVLASEPVRFRVAREPADEAVVYRLVTPPFWVLKTPDTFVRDLRSFDIRPFLLSRRKYCFNCHAFSSPTGTDGMLAVQSRYLPQDHDGLRVYFGVFDLATRQGWKARLPFEIQMTTYMAWSPDGRRLATSANQQVTVFPPIIHETQMAGEPTSDVAVYDLGRQEAFLLPGASDPQRLELFPRWTPDGKWIVFCSAPPAAHPEMVRYDLCVVPYNDGRGGEPQPIPGASANGRSNYFPRFSPDGRWFTFCQADGGDLMRSSSNIFIMGADLKGPARRLECNADHAADSWHSWSSNSRWLVFASKRDDGAFARLYLAHVDDQGRAAPAVALPLKQPPLQSFNIPEFLAKAPRIEERALFDALRVEGPAVSVKGP